MTACESCRRIALRDRGETPVWDAIVRTADYDLVHAYNSALLGWLVLLPRRHITAVDQLNEREAAALGPLLQRASAALRAELGCAKTYIVQFAESPEHPHVHFHIVPRMADMPAERRGPAVFGYLGSSDELRVSDQAMNDLALGLRRRLTEFATET